jgi:hypothetical protein
MNLHVLTPISQLPPKTLARQAEYGDRIIDLRPFPPLAYEVDAEGMCRDITSGLIETRDYWIVVRDWLTGFTAQTGLQDILSIKGYGFWWTHVGQRFVPGLTELGNSFAWIDLLHALCAESQPGRALLHGRHEASLHVVREVCRDIHPEVLAEPSAGPQRRTRIPRHLVLLAIRLLLSLIYLIYSLIRRPDMILLSNTNLLRETSAGAHRRLRDVYLGAVEEALRRKGWHVTVAEMYGWNASWAGLVARGFFFPSDIVTTSSALARTGSGFYHHV